MQSVVSGLSVRSAQPRVFVANQAQVNSSREHIEVIRRPRDDDDDDENDAPGLSTVEAYEHLLNIFHFGRYFMLLVVEF